MIKVLGVVLLGLLGFSDTLLAAEVCKVTDPETGITNFSECSAAANGAVTVNVNPINTVKSTDITRGKGFQSSPVVGNHTTKSDQVAKAKSKQEAAKEALEAAKVIQPGDRVSTANGSRLSDAYFERVKKAEAEYAKAVGN